MFIDTSVEIRIFDVVRTTWNECHELALTGVWLILAGLTAFSSAGGCGGCPNPSPPGSISLAWSITDLAGRPTTCAGVNAQTVALQLRNRANGNTIAAAFPCANSPSTTQLVAGAYDITIALQAADGTRLATAPDQIGITIVSGQVKELQPVTFAASTQSSLVISLATPDTTNCQPMTLNGAGITGTTITLQRVGDGCEAVTFIRTQGATQRGTYTVNCSSPAVATCIEKSETLTTSLESGAVLIRVRGKIGVVDCWQRDAILEVPPPGKPLVHMLELALQNIPGC